MPGQPMRVRDLAENGVTAVRVICPCGHTSEVKAAGLPTDLTMIGLSQRFRCLRCEKKGIARVEPAWDTRKQTR